MCNAATSQTKTRQASGSRSNSAGSEEGVTGSPTDSNPSMDKPEVVRAPKVKTKDHHHSYGTFVIL